MNGRRPRQANSRHTDTVSVQNAHRQYISLGLGILQQDKRFCCHFCKKNAILQNFDNIIFVFGVFSLLPPIKLLLDWFATNLAITSRPMYNSDAQSISIQTHDTLKQIPYKLMTHSNKFHTNSWHIETNSIQTHDTLKQIPYKLMTHLNNFHPNSRPT